MPDTATLLRFSRCQLNLAARELTVDDELVDLQPLVFDLLAYMAQNPNRVIGKDELLNAVWRSPYVTDSVVTRAVMKARRAIMDDARAPNVLRTVQRVGYRFDGQVVRQADASNAAIDFAVTLMPSAAVLDLAVLPWVGGPCEVEGMGFELACVVHHLLERNSSQALLPMADVLYNWAHLPQSADALATACKTFGVSAVVSFEVSPSRGGSWQLLVKHGASHLQATRYRIEGPDVWSLALQAIHALCPNTAGDVYAAPALPGLQLLGRGLYLELCGTATDAIVPLQKAHAQLAPSAWLDLALARLSWKNRDDAQALSLAACALARPEAQASRDLQIQLLFARGMGHEISTHLTEAATAFEQAYQLACQPNPAFDRRGEILSLWSLMATRLGQPERGRRLAEQAVLHATAMGHTSTQAYAKLSQGQILTLMEQTERASEVMKQAAALALACRSKIHQALSLRVQSLLMLTLRRFKACVDLGRQAMALYNQIGRPSLAGSCQVNLYAALIDGDQIEQALQEQGRLVLTSPERRRAIDGFNAALDWKLDRVDAAIGTLQRLCTRHGDPPTLAQREYDYFLARHLVFLGRLNEARGVLDTMEDDASQERPLLVKADLAFAQGDRAACIALLRQVWTTINRRNENVMDAAIDLAWLLLEAQGAGQADDELESLVAHLIDYSDDYPPSNLLVGAYLLRSMPSDTSRARWDAAVRQARTFSRRYPHMATPEFRDALERGAAPQAPGLLTQLCQ